MPYGVTRPQWVNSHKYSIQLFFSSTVTATDLDSVTNSQLTYSVSDANFTVESLNNIGYIKTARWETGGGGGCDYTDEKYYRN